MDSRCPDTAILVMPTVPTRASDGWYYDSLGGSLDSSVSPHKLCATVSLTVGQMPSTDIVSERHHKSSRDSQSGSDDLQSGSDDLQSGSDDLQSGSGDLQSGSDDLQSGSDDLQSGSDDLQSGSGNLQSGSDDLRSGSGDLQSSSDDEKGGSGDLQSGSSDEKHGSSDLQRGSNRAEPLGPLGLAPHAGRVGNEGDGNPSHGCNRDCDHSVLDRRTDRDGREVEHIKMEREYRMKPERGPGTFSY